MAEYIEREELKRSIKMRAQLNETEKSYICALIDGMPAADVYTEEDVRDAYTDGFSEGMAQGMEKAVVDGRWESEHETWGQLQCSVCKKEALLEKVEGDDGRILLYVTSNYCPNCGAKMDGEGGGG